jgi:nitrogen fixation protein NifU and related proteins
MSDILDLYQDLIIDHSRAPKNFGELSDRTHHAYGKNPLCGDDIKLDLKIHENFIISLAFTGDGCAIAKASASLMTEALKNKSLQDALILFANFHAMLVNESENTSNLGKLEAFKGVRQFPTRVKCATLCWHTFNAALTSPDSTVTTE